MGDRVRGKGLHGVGLRWLTMGALLALSCGVRAQAQAPQAEISADPKPMIQTMLAKEDFEAKHKGHFAYLSKERSDRTGGHLWTEKVVETSAGKVRMLLEEDGRPIAPERVAAERGRLAAIAADPAGFARREQGQKDDDAHAKQMLSLLPRAFLFGDVREENGELRMDFKPDPAYAPQSMEERVLHGMSGTLWIDAKATRLHRIEGRLPQDVTIGFGLLATIKAGSDFATDRDPVDGGEWKTAIIDTDINGKAIFFKAIARKQHTERSDYRLVPMDMTVAQAVALVEQ